MLGMSPNEVFTILAQEHSNRATQAHYDKEAFAREKRGYAARLRVVLSQLGFGEVCAAGTLIRALIADLEGE